MNRIPAVWQLTSRTSGLRNCGIRGSGRADGGERRWEHLPSPPDVEQHNRVFLFLPDTWYNPGFHCEASAWGPTQTRELESRVRPMGANQQPADHRQSALPFMAGKVELRREAYFKNYSLNT